MSPHDANPADASHTRPSVLHPPSATELRAAAAPRASVITAAGLVVFAIILAIDLAEPSHYATAILYTLPILAAFWLPSPPATLILALAGSLCLAIGYFNTPVAPPAGPVETIVYRATAFALLWFTAILAILYQVARFAAEHSSIARRHQAALLHAILETAPDALVVIDQTGIIQSFSRSAERLFGYAADETIGRNVSMLMAAPTRAEHDGNLARYLATGERRIIGIGRVVEGQTKDGRLVPIELAVGEAKVAQQRVFIGFMRDLSARHRIEDELRQAQKMEAVGQLTGGIAHDFNNLLLVISGNLELIEARPDHPDPVAIKEAREAAELGAELTAQLLAFARKQSLDPKEVDVGDLINSVASMLSRTLGDHIDIAVSVNEGAGRAVVDAAQLQTALLNLAINARDAMEGGGHLAIAVFNTELDARYAEVHPEVRLGPYVAVQVADSGTGMSEDVLERVFEPFFTTKKAGAGNGLGLSMVYGFTKQSNGHVDIESRVGEGTTVTLYLPRATDPQAHPAAADGHSSPHAGDGELILVVEDDARVRRVAIARLRDLGYRTLAASSGPEALSALAAHPQVSLLFTDVVMAEGMSGFELARQARQRLPSLPLLYTTGYANPAAFARTDEAERPAGPTLRKPYSRDELARAVRAALDR